MEKHSAIILLALVVVANGYINMYDEEFFFKCQPYQFVSQVVSVHHNGYEDRRFEMSCTDVLRESERPRTPECFNTGYVNQFDEVVAFQCPNKGYIAGIGSIHSNGNEDRMWKFFCCTMPRTRLEDCKFTEWTNQFDGIQHFHVETGFILRGMVSWHHDGNEDRRFRYEVCRLVKEF